LRCFTAGLPHSFASATELIIAGLQPLKKPLVSGLCDGNKKPLGGGLWILFSKKIVSARILYIFNVIARNSAVCIKSSMPDIYGMGIRILRIHAGNMKNFSMIFRRRLVVVDVVFSLMPMRVHKLDCADQIKSAHISSSSD
jgi:hypothetical protein